MNDDEPIITTEFKNSRTIDVSIQLKTGETIGSTIANNEHRLGRLFCELAALYQEDERLKVLMDKYDIVIFAASAEEKNGCWDPEILFETLQAKKAREAQRAF